MHCAGDDLERLAIELEVVADGAKAVAGSGCDLSEAWSGEDKGGEKSEGSNCRESHSGAI